jgi:peptidoglycan/xylan/chitin deacetylase (PgdA/CDA1 family)
MQKVLKKKLRKAIKAGICIGAVFFAFLFIRSYFLNETKKWAEESLWEVENDRAALSTEVLSEAETKKIALTYDDGPHPVYTEELLQVLEEYQVNATFFLLGKEAELYPEIVKSIAEAGHTIGNHSYSHDNLQEMGLTEARKECDRTAEILHTICGQNTEFYRPPFGSAPDELEKTCNMVQVLWDIDTRDWECQDAGTVVRCVLQQAEENDIILMHDAYASTVEATRQLIPLLQEQGFTFVTVEELLLP